MPSNLIANTDSYIDATTEFEQNTFQTLNTMSNNINYIRPPNQKDHVQVIDDSLNSEHFSQSYV